MKNTRFFLKNTILGGQIQKIENIEGFRVFKTLKMLNIHNTSGFTPKTIVVLSSRCTRLPISAPQGAKIRLGVGSEAQRGSKSEKCEFLRI